ncbi:MAG: AsmA family protein, partial [Acetobacteraceae bacterium]|nr:AsmA family protein [Acetobacteraceae bacterium]
MIRRLAIVCALLLAAIAGALWLGPRFVDWEAQRPRLAALAAIRLGRPVALEGRLRLAFLPQPQIEASRVHVGAPGEDIDIAARRMHLRLDLGALLTGRLEPREIALVGAELRLPW